MSGIFLDRDGVIIRKAADGEYIASVAEMEFLPGSAEAIAELSRSGFKVIVVTNQRGVATGKVTLPDLEEIHIRLTQVVAGIGGCICDIFYCPHDLSENCMCRKPRAGMLLRAAEKYALPVSECWMVGDSESDITAGKIVGCKTALITHSQQFSDWADQPDIWTDSLASVTKWILGSTSNKSDTSR
jgi:histidinol-phosphate phosphatase family protein